MSKSCCHILHSSIFKKTVVAITGIAMVGFVFVHMLGNLQIFAGAGLTAESTKINQYAALLKKEALILWGARLFLLATIAIHVGMTMSLARANRAARPQAYQARKSYATPAAKMMVFGGITLLLYIIYHILHFTTGTIHAELYTGSHDVYRNMILSFQNPLIVLIYVAAQVALFGHLYHGTVSVFQTLGMSNKQHLACAKVFGLGLSLIICLGFISIPLGVFFGWVA